MTQATTLMTSITLNGRTESNVVTDAKGSHAKGSHATSVSSKGFAVSQLA